MYRHWTREDTKASSERLHNLYELYPCASHIIYAPYFPYNVLSFFVFAFFYESYFMKMLS